MLSFGSYGPQRIRFLHSTFHSLLMLVLHLMSRVFSCPWGRGRKKYVHLPSSGSSLWSLFVKNINIFVSKNNNFEGVGCTGGKQTQQTYLWNLEISPHQVLWKTRAIIKTIQSLHWIKTMLPYICTFLSAFLSFIQFNPAGNLEKEVRQILLSQFNGKGDGTTKTRTKPDPPKIYTKQLVCIFLTVK